MNVCTASSLKWQWQIQGRFAVHSGSERRCAGTYIIQDCERFGQRFAQQPDPFGKQLVEMFTEVLTDNGHRWKRKQQSHQSNPIPSAYLFITSRQFDRDSHFYWFCRLGPKCHSNTAPHSGSPGYTEEIQTTFGWILIFHRSSEILHRNVFTSQGCTKTWQFGLTKTYCNDVEEVIISECV